MLKQAHNHLNISETRHWKGAEQHTMFTDLGEDKRARRYPGRCCRDYQATINKNFRPSPLQFLKTNLKRLDPLGGSAPITLGPNVEQPCKAKAGPNARSI